MQVGQQILHVLRTQHLAVACHIRAAVANNVAHAVVIRRQSSLGKILVPENALQSRTFLSLGGIRPVAAVAVVVINLASVGLLRLRPSSAFDLRRSTSQPARVPSARHATRDAIVQRRRLNAMFRSLCSTFLVRISIKITLSCDYHRSICAQFPTAAHRRSTYNDKAKLQTPCQLP